MIHDEKTTEIELPTMKKPSQDDNIVRVKFTENRMQPIKKVTKAVAVTLEPSRLRWFKELELSSPWVIRLFAVLAVLILSMLVL